MSSSKELGTLQKVLLIFLAAATLVTVILFPILSRREGIEYNGALLAKSTDGENTLYSGKLNGEKAVFTVTADGEIRFRVGDTEYGPYTVTEAPSAYPPKVDLGAFPTGQGIEVRCGGDLIFRGGYADLAGTIFLISEDGSTPSVSGWYASTAAAGEPELAEIIRIWAGPELTHRGNGEMLAMGLCCAILAAVLILYAEKLFRWAMAFRVREPENVEPSEWELFTRSLSQVIMSVLAGVSYILSLTTIV